MILFRTKRKALFSLTMQLISSNIASNWSLTSFVSDPFIRKFYTTFFGNSIFFVSTEVFHRLHILKQSRIRLKFRQNYWTRIVVFSDSSMFFSFMSVKTIKGQKAFSANITNERSRLGMIFQGMHTNFIFRRKWYSTIRTIVTTMLLFGMPLRISFH